MGILIDGVVAAPDNYNIGCRPQEEQQEPLVMKEEDGHIFLDYNGEMGEPCQINMKKLSAEHIAKIVEAVKKQSPKDVEYTYRFPTAELGDVNFSMTTKRNKRLENSDVDEWSSECFAKGRA